MLVHWPVEKMVMNHCKVEPSIFCTMINGQVSLMVDVRVDDIIVSGEKPAFFDELKKSFPVKHQGQMKLYIGCAFERIWEKSVRDIKQMAFME